MASPNHKSVGGQSTLARILSSPLRANEVKLTPGNAHLILLASGNACITGNDEDLYLPAPGMAWLPAGHTGRLRLEAGSRASLLSINDVCLAHAFAKGTNALFPRNGLDRVLTETLSQEHHAELAGYVKTIASENLRPTAATQTLILNLLCVALIRICQSTASAITATSMPSSIAERFVLLVAQHKRDHWNVETYARHLGISRDRLGSIIKAATGLSPKAYIHRELFSEARELLLNSSFQVSEIAYRLGFQDSGYFNRFFTRIEGISPGRLRRAAFRFPAEPAHSFAAWP